MQIKADGDTIGQIGDWRLRLNYDPLPALVSSKSKALTYFVMRDLMGLDLGPTSGLWELPTVARILRTQERNGSWRYRNPQKRIRSQEDYDQLETFRVLRVLVEKYGVDRTLPAFENAAEFLFDHQTSEGDFRGICGNQFTPYYSAAMTELLVKGGYSEDRRIENSFRWLQSIRQNDGGWAFPMRTHGLNLGPRTFKSPTVQPDRSKPFSHLVTGMVLRAFAAHPKYRWSREASEAGELLSRRIFQADKYPDRKAPSFWTSFSYPFWFTDLLSALDSLSRLEFGTENIGVGKGIEWLAQHQEDTGLWRLPLRITGGEKDGDYWISLAICRVFRRLGPLRRLS